MVQHWVYAYFLKEERKLHLFIHITAFAYVVIIRIMCLYESLLALLYESVALALIKSSLSSRRTLKEWVSGEQLGQGKGATLDGREE